MNEIRVVTPKGKAREIAKIALEMGIQEVSVSSVYVYGPDEEKDQLSMEVSVLQARHFMDALLTAPFFDINQYSVSSDQLMSIVSQMPAEKISWPLEMGATTILQDLWLQNHITISYMARAFIAALLLSYALLKADILTLLAALLFTPFLSQVLAMSFGALVQDWHLARQGFLALATSTGLTIIAGAIAAAAVGGQLQYDQFGTLLSNFVISLIVGIAAGLDTADKSGRREFIAVAAAAQFAAFPAWFGISLVLGFPDRETTLWRITTFFVNILTILVVSIGVYAALRYRPEVLKRYLKGTHENS